MGKQTPSQAKNTIKRSLFEIISPAPTDKEKKEIWEYYEYSCAYCGRELKKDERKGHLDHIKPISNGGTNSKYNLLLSCSICNGDEKRDMDWDEFLKEKNTNINEYNRRKTSIEIWKARDQFAIDDKVLSDVNELITEAIVNYDLFVEKVRGISTLA
jgi:5-methylcytosine-specific restriction endonuclease McrA